MSEMVVSPDEAPALDEPIRDALLDSAAARFAHYGPRKTTMDEVARTAGFSRTTLYAHFRNKESLYAALLERASQRFVRQVRQCLDQPGSPGSKLRRIVEIARGVYAEDPVLLAAVTRTPGTQMEHVAREVLQRTEGAVVGLLERAVRQGVESGEMRQVDPQRVAYLMFELGNVLVIREVTGRGELPLSLLLDQMDDLIHFGLAAPRVPGGSRP